MDHAIQAELVGIVSAIIDKFGQNAAQSHPKPNDQVKEVDNQHTSEQQMLLELAEENEKLNIYINEIEAELEK